MTRLLKGTIVILMFFMLLSCFGITGVYAAPLQENKDLNLHEVKKVKPNEVLQDHEFAKQPEVFKSTNRMSVKSDEDFYKGNKVYDIAYVPLSDFEKIGINPLPQQQEFNLFALFQGDEMQDRNIQIIDWRYVYKTPKFELIMDPIAAFNLEDSGAAGYIWMIQSTMSGYCVVEYLFYNIDTKTYYSQEVEYIVEDMLKFKEPYYHESVKGLITPNTFLESGKSFELELGGNVKSLKISDVQKAYFLVDGKKVDTIKPRVVSNENGNKSYATLIAADGLSESTINVTISYIDNEAKLEGSGLILIKIKPSQNTVTK